MGKEGSRQEAAGRRQQAEVFSFEFLVLSVEAKIQNSKFKIKNWATGALALGLVAVVGGCGYGFSAKGEAFPKDVQKVFVETLVNRTREVGLEGDVTAALRNELRQKGQLRLVTQLDQADAILSGVVRNYDIRAVGTNRHDEALQYELTMVLDMTLRRRSPDEILWRTQGVRFAELYSGSRGAVVTTSSEFKSRPLNAADVPRFTDVQLTETLKQEARDRLMAQAARDVLQRMLELF